MIRNKNYKIISGNNDFMQTTCHAKEYTFWTFEYSGNMYYKSVFEFPKNTVHLYGMQRLWSNWKKTNTLQQRAKDRVQSAGHNLNLYVFANKLTNVFIYKTTKNGTSTDVYFIKFISFLKKMETGALFVTAVCSKHDVHMYRGKCDSYSNISRSANPLESPVLVLSLLHIIWGF